MYEDNFTASKRISLINNIETILFKKKTTTKQKQKNTTF